MREGSVMKDSSRAGMRRLSMRVAALSAMPVLAFAQGGGAGGGGVGVRAGVIQRDSTRTSAPQLGVVMIQTSPRIDSLVRSMSKLQLGSPEYLATQDSLRAEFRQLAERVKDGPSAGRVRLAPTAAGGFGGDVLPAAPDVTPRGRMGFRADGLNEIIVARDGQYIQYFEYPTVVEVEANSPASKSGLKVGDLLLAYDGFDLRRQAINMTRLLTPGREVEIRLRRDGAPRDLTLQVERGSAMFVESRRAQGTLVGPPPIVIIRDSADRREVETRAAAMAGAVSARVTAQPTTAFITAPRTMSASGVYGAAMMDIDADLAESIVGMTGRKNGVYVISVPTGSIAERNGLKRGDAILRLDTNEIPSIAHLRVRLMQAEATGADKVKLTVLRGGKVQELTIDTNR
jgi:membrane-associated protease RseP (regulator of RpoE activity)